MARFAQFDFRETAAGAPPESMGLHRDRPGSADAEHPERGGVSGWGKRPDDGTLYYEGEPRRAVEGPPPAIDYLCAITYLTDVSPSSPAFAVVPNSFRVPVTAQHAASEVKAQLGDAYRPAPLYGSAGTLVLYDIATFHTRADPLDVQGNRIAGERRRTQHRYFGRQGACGSDAALTPWALAPQRLADSDDPSTRRFYSQQNYLMRSWAGSGFSRSFLRQHAERLNLERSPLVLDE